MILDDSAEFRIVRKAAVSSNHGAAVLSAAKARCRDCAFRLLPHGSRIPHHGQ